MEEIEFNELASGLKSQDIKLMKGYYRENFFMIVAAVFCLKDKEGKCGSVAIVNSRRNGASRC